MKRRSILPIPEDISPDSPDFQRVLNERLSQIDDGIAQAGSGTGSSPSTNLTVVQGGGASHPARIVVQVSADVTLDPVAQEAEVTSAGGPVAVRLPSFANWIGAEITITKISADANAVSVLAQAGQTFNGLASKILATQWESLTIMAVSATKGTIVASSVANTATPITAPDPPLAVAGWEGDLAGRWLSTPENLTFTWIYASVTLPPGSDAGWETIWVTSYDGLGWDWIGVYAVGAPIKFARIAPASATNWRIKATLGKVGAESPPAAAVASPDFAVAGLSPVAGSGPASATFASATYEVRASNPQFWWPTVQWTNPSDVNFWYCSLTVQRVNQAGTAAPGLEGQERECSQGEGDNCKPGGVVFFHEKGGWGLPNISEPVPSGFRYYIFRLYAYNRAGAKALCSAWSGADHFTIYVSQSAQLDPGSLPPGGITASQIGSVSASTIVGAITASQIGSVNAGSISGTLTAGQIGSVNASSITGTVTAAQVGSVNASAITGTIVASQIATVNASAVQGTLTAAQIATVNAGSISGTLTAGQIGSVNASSITGVIVTSQVADGLIASLAKIATSLQPIARVTSLPGLPNPAYPLGCYVLNTSTKTLYYNSNNSVWTATTASSAVTGSLTAADIISVNAGAITGLIAAGQIGSVNASSITGALSAGQIGSVNASSITGALTASQIGTVNAASITIGLIGDSQIGSVSAGKVTAGTIQIYGGTLTVQGASASVTVSSTGISLVGLGAARIDITASGITVGSGAALYCGAVLSSGNISLVSLSSSYGGVVIDSSRQYRWPNVYADSLPLGSLTATHWVPCYDTAGTYWGKIPIIP
jgi:hypothetical protein